MEKWLFNNIHLFCCFYYFGCSGSVFRQTVVNYQNFRHFNYLLGEIKRAILTSGYGLYKKILYRLDG